MQHIPEMVQPSSASTAAFMANVLALCALFVYGATRAGRPLDEPVVVQARWGIGALLGLGLLLVIDVAIVGSSVLERATMPPPLMLFIFGNLAVVATAAFSPLGTRLVQGVPIAALVGFQAFRLPLELVLHAWYEQGVLPVQMTYSGHNFDIVSGTLAALVGLWLATGRAPRWSVWAFNLIGSALLAAVATIAVLSTPLPIRQYLNDPPVLLAFHVPYVFILPACVGGALFGHLLVFRWLAQGRGSA